MPIKPIGWICGQVIKRFSGQVYIIQRTVMEIIDEIKDEFPTIIRLQQSNQVKQIDPILQASRSVVASAFSSSQGVRVINGLNRISTSSKSVAKVLQPQLVHNFAELNTMSHRLLKNVNMPKQPLYKNQGRPFSLFDVLSYPAKTALTSIMCASYAALIYVDYVQQNIILNGFLNSHASVTQESEQALNVVNNVLFSFHSALSQLYRRLKEIVIYIPQVVTECVMYTLRQP
uniref:Spermatogenesis associated 9 n=1 Tax=Pelusios castaneus TaxID=367368 RepID=A0A8C8SDX8_9SAUR